MGVTWAPDAPGEIFSRLPDEAISYVLTDAAEALFEDEAEAG